MFEARKMASRQTKPPEVAKPSGGWPYQGGPGRRYRDESSISSPSPPVKRKEGNRCSQTRASRARFSSDERAPSDLPDQRSTQDTATLSHLPTGGLFPGQRASSRQSPLVGASGIRHTSRFYTVSKSKAANGLSELVSEADRGPGWYGRRGMAEVCR